jgi:hypothetical protein
VLGASLTTVPLDVQRTVSVAGADVVVSELVTNRSSAPTEFIWTHHPGLGGDLLGAPVRLDTNARGVRLDDRAAAVGIDADLGDQGRWPLIGPRQADLRFPIEGGALLAYLADFAGDPWVSLARQDGSLEVKVSWDNAIFPYCWIWQELGGTLHEPSTSWPGQGLARVAGSTGTTFFLAGRASVSSVVTLTVLAATDSLSIDGEER